jgi:hypothetical protein
MTEGRNSMFRGEEVNTFVSQSRDKSSQDRHNASTRINYTIHSIPIEPNTFSTHSKQSQMCTIYQGITIALPNEQQE